MAITAEQEKIIGEICRAFARKVDSGSKPGPFLIELTKLFPDPSPLQKKILRETRRAFRETKETESPKGMLEEILMVLCSWGDTLEETQVLAYMQAIAEHGTYKLRNRDDDQN